MFCLVSKIRPAYSSESCPLFSKSSITDRPQWSTKYSISAEQSLNFWVIIEQLSYRLISLHINRIYNLFIVKWSYEDQSINVSNKFLSFHYHMQIFDCQSINSLNWTFILFTFNSFMRQRSNNCSNVYGIVIYTIYSPSNYQYFITIKR